MSIHADSRRNSADAEERADWERDLRLEYAREEYEERHPYEDDTEITCNYQGEDGSCNCDDSRVYQKGKWKDACGVWKDEGEEE